MKPGILQEQIVVLQQDCADFGLAPPELQIAEVEDDLNKQQAGKGSSKCALIDHKQSGRWRWVLPLPLPTLSVLLLSCQGSLQFKSDHGHAI